MQKSDTVLPLGSGTTTWQLDRTARGTTMHETRYKRRGADVKNYIRPYYRDAAALGPGATVLRLQRSGTTMGSRGTTAPWHGTTAPRGSTTASTATTAKTIAKRINRGGSKVQGKGGDKEGNVYVMIPPKP